jgi:RNA polymerase sigma-70 factor (ECF subfamily)
VDPLLVTIALGCGSIRTKPSSATVSAKRTSGNADASQTTLGDLLYADRSGAAVGEDEWVRLVTAIAAADQQAMRLLYERSRRLVFTLALRISGDPQSAEEITLDVFHDVWRRAGSYDPEGGTVIGWIMNQTRSRAIDRLRYEHRKKRTPPEPHADDGQGDAPGPGGQIDARQRRVRLEQAMTRLTPDEREAIETAYFGELTYAETATRLDQPLGTVKTRVRSALGKLRKALEGEGEPS